MNSNNIENRISNLKKNAAQKLADCFQDFLDLYTEDEVGDPIEDLFKETTTTVDDFIIKIALSDYFLADIKEVLKAKEVQENKEVECLDLIRDEIKNIYLLIKDQSKRIGVLEMSGNKEKKENFKPNTYLNRFIDTSIKEIKNQISYINDRINFIQLQISQESIDDLE